MDQIAVLIPCFNEAKTIHKVVKDWKDQLPDAVIYVYDNNSTDGTASIAGEAGAIVRYERQQGKGNVVRRMFHDIDAKCYVMVDGDDTYPAEHGRAMVTEVLEGNVDMVVGDRLSSTYFSENKRRFHNFGNALVRGAINHMFKNRTRDIMTGCRALSYRFVKSFPIVSQGFEIETEMTIHAIDKNMHMTNQVIAYRDRPEGSKSKLNTFSDGIRIIKTILHLYSNYRPLQFLGMIASLLVLTATALFVPIAAEYEKTGLVPRLPTLIVCGFLVIAALLSFFSGLILAAIKHKERREFEFKLHEISNWYKTSPNNPVDRRDPD